MVDLIGENISGENLVLILKRKIENFEILYLSGYNLETIRAK